MTYLRKLALAAALPAAFAAQTASAALVDVWSYEVDNTFSAFTERACTGTISAANCAASVVVSSLPNPDLGGGTRLAWGKPVGTKQSALSVTGEVNGDDLVTNDGNSLGATLTHENFVQTLGGHSLATATLLTRIILNPFQPVPSNTVNETLIADFLINFKETPNSNPCPQGDPFVTPCSDVFVISPPDLADLVQTFIHDGFKYTLTLGVVGLGPLTDAQCSAADADPGCIGFITEENKTSTFQAFFNIKAEPVVIPEPASLALLGLTFLGLGAAGKLRKRA